MSLLGECVVRWANISFFLDGFWLGQQIGLRLSLLTRQGVCFARRFFLILRLCLRLVLLGEWFGSSGEDLDVSLTTTCVGKQSESTRKLT